MNLVVCADIGSTYTKAALVDVDTGALVATASRPTTADTDVLDGFDGCVADLAAPADAPRTVCSSAGGGLRLAVVGYEPLVTAHAGHQVGLSAGARVVHVSGGPLDGAGVAALRAARPDLVLLVGGTDGGDDTVIRHNVGRLASARLRRPVVVAGNADAAADCAHTLAARDIPVRVAGNVLPAIGVLNPLPAREAIRQAFLSHVIGGKRLSRSPRFARLVRSATPDAVLAGVEVLADGAPGVPGVGQVLVIDVGGATTDVYSVLTPTDAAAPAAGVLWRARTVEGDLGVRVNAPGIVAAAATERLLRDGADGGLVAAAQARAADPGLLPATDADAAVDARLAALAASVAARRHARGSGRSGAAYTTRRDLTGVRLVVGSGGVLRHATPDAAAGVLAAVLGDHAGGWPLPEQAATTVDTRYVLAACGLLAAEHPVAAARLAARLAT